MAAWQVPSLLHLNAIVQSNPQYKHDFEATVTFLSGQLSHQMLKHSGGPGRNISTAQTESDGGSQPKASDSKIKKLERQIKALKNAQGNGKGNGGKSKPHKVNKQAKLSNAMQLIDY